MRSGGGAHKKREAPRSIDGNDARRWHFSPQPPVPSPQSLVTSPQSLVPSRSLQPQLGRCLGSFSGCDDALLGHEGEDDGHALRAFLRV